MSRDLSPWAGCEQGQCRVCCGLMCLERLCQCVCLGGSFLSPFRSRCCLSVKAIQMQSGVLGCPAHSPTHWTPMPSSAELRTKFGKTALMQAAEKNSLESVRALLNLDCSCVRLPGLSRLALTPLSGMLAQTLPWRTTGASLH